MEPKLALIGAGNLGSAIVRGAMDAGVLKPHEILIAEIDAPRREAMATLGCQVSHRTEDAARSDQIMLAVKPQNFADVARSLGMIKRSAVVISIMAGTRSARIREALGPNARVVRVMPNTPCQVGAGMAAIALGEGAMRGDEALASALFNPIARTVMVDESVMDAVTATNGSGPAYVFLLAEAMEEAAKRMGIEPATARTLVVQTILGAGRMLVEAGQTPAQLREAVTSRGGTTAAALGVFEQRGFTDMVIQAMAAARARGEELSR